MTQLTKGYDPIELGRKVEELVCRRGPGGLERRYYRFRGGKWYGGIATADCVGCNLRCGFCWSWKNCSHTTSVGSFYSPGDVARIVVGIAARRGYRQVRVSGGEPTLCFEHLTDVVRRVPRNLLFVLETNGILIGHDKRLAREIARLDNVVVRVSIKGTTPEEFQALTGARSEFFEMQLRALENLLEAGLEPGRQFYPAIMLSFSDEESAKRLLKRLAEIHPELALSVDPEYVILYPHVRELMNRRGLKPLKAYTPEGVPEFMI